MVSKVSEEIGITSFKNIKNYGGDSTKIIVSGSSAGGYLTMMVGLDKSYLKKHQIDANDIFALLPLTGHAITHFTVRSENGVSREQPIIDRYAPLYHVRSDAPPIVLYTGDPELEMLGRAEENSGSAGSWNIKGTALGILRRPCGVVAALDYRHGNASCGCLRAEPV